MKFTEGGFKEWGYAIAKKEFGAHLNESGELFWTMVLGLKTVSRMHFYKNFTTPRKI